jgi:hypothetical protein
MMTDPPVGSLFCSEGGKKLHTWVGGIVGQDTKSADPTSEESGGTARLQDIFEWGIDLQQAPVYVHVEMRVSSRWRQQTN